MSAKRESAEEVGSSTTSSSRRSVQDVSQSQLSSNKSTTHLAVSVEGATIVASKRSRSVDFGLHRIRSLSTQPTPTSTQPPSRPNVNLNLFPIRLALRNPVSNSSASLRSRRPPQPHQVVETTTIYDKHEQPTRVVSPHGQPEDSQGKVNQYLILRDIGRGSFGRVTYFACKIISKSRLKRQFRFSNDHLSSVKKEIAILKKLSRHPNINALVEVLSDDNEDNLYMIFELCEYGPVMNLKTNETVRPFDENLARKYFRDMILGIEYLHKKHVIHRDLKPENLLLTADMVVQIADFGISHMFDGQDDSLEDKNASPAFCPPEACDSKAPRISGKAFDMWSLGVTLYCMVHGRCPFEDESIMEVYRKIIEEEPMISPHLSPALKDLMRGLMEKDAYNRWKLEDVRRCDWITDFGRDPLISVEQNCDFETSVTDQEIEDAFSPLSKLITRIKNILTFKRKNSSKSNAVGVSPVDDAKAKSSSNISLPSKGILRRNSGTSTERIA
ncbi:kinase-like domain-containing protein [Chytridium lagenaria]|nr:kinase-like domain-containing protein [Chytridium lagenaria]